MPSSGVAGIAVYCLPPCTLFVVLSCFSPTFVVDLLQASFHLRSGRPLLLSPGMSTSIILLTMCSSFILLPYRFSHFSVVFLDACATLVVPQMGSFWILSLLVTLHIHLDQMLVSISNYHTMFSITQEVANIPKCSLQQIIFQNCRQSNTQI